MEISFSNIPQIIKNSKVRQISSLYSSLVISIISGIGVSYTLTRLLTPETFGNLKFVQNICSFVVVFFTMGFFYTGSLTIARCQENKQKHEYIGGITVIAFVIAIFYSSFIFFGSWLEQLIFKNELDYIFRCFAPLLFIYPFEQYCQNILVGDNKIHILSIYRLAPKIIYLVSCILWNNWVTPLTLNSAFGLFLFSSAIVILYSIIRLKPRFRKIRRSVSYIYKENKNYGFPLYLGALVSFSSAQLGGIFIAYYIDTENVGYFSLAITSTTALTLIPSTVGTTFFKEFTQMNKIPSKVIKVTVVISILALVGFLFLIKPLVVFLYTEEYLAVIPLAHYIAIGSVLQGFGDFFNRYISSQGLGKKLRNSSFIIGGIYMVGFSFSTRFFGVEGAALTRLLSGFVYLILMLYIYNNSIKGEKQ